MLGLKLVQRHAAADVHFARAGGAADLRRQIGQAYLCASDKNDTTFDGIAQFTDIPRPWVMLQRRAQLPA